MLLSDLLDRCIEHHVEEFAKDPDIIRINPEDFDSLVGNKYFTEAVPNSPPFYKGVALMTSYQVPSAKHVDLDNPPGVKHASKSSEGEAEANSPTSA